MSNATEIMELQKLSGMEKFSKLPVKQWMDREKLIELLEDRRLAASEVCGSMNKGFGAWYADHLIANNVVPVVRCKDCKCNGACSIQDAMNWTPRTEIGDYFCSYGERREGE